MPHESESAMKYKPLGITPSELFERPELAVLQVLDHTLGIARFALTAAHPELTDADPAVVPRTLEALAADHVMTATDALTRAIASYRRALAADGRRVRTASQVPPGVSF